MTSLDLPRQWPLVAPLVVALVSVAWYLIGRSRSRSSRIDLEDLLLGDDARFSTSKLVLLGSWMMATWLIVYLAVSDKLTEGYFGLYTAAFVVPTIAQGLKARPQAEHRVAGARGDDDR